MPGIRKDPGHFCLQRMLKRMSSIEQLGGGSQKECDGSERVEQGLRPCVEAFEMSRL
jgi:hypothetical protein